MFRLTYTSKAGETATAEYDTRESAIRGARTEYGIPACYWTYQGGYTVEVSYYGKVVAIREVTEEPEAPVAPQVCTSAKGGGKAHLASAFWLKENASVYPVCRTMDQNRVLTKYTLAPEGSEVSCKKCQAAIQAP